MTPEALIMKCNEITPIFANADPSALSLIEIKSHHAPCDVLLRVTFGQCWICCLKDLISRFSFRLLAEAVTQ